MIITIAGPIEENGMVLDFKVIKEIVKDKVISKLDHTHLNDTLENPSAENLAIWVWDKLKNELPLKRISIYETENYSCTYEGK